MQCTRIILKPFSTHPGSTKELSFMKPVPDAKKAEDGWDNSRLEDWRSYFKFNSGALPSSHMGAHKLMKKNRKKKKEDGRSPIHLTFSSHICRLFPLRQGHNCTKKTGPLILSGARDTIQTLRMLSYLLGTLGYIWFITTKVNGNQHLLKVLKRYEIQV